MPSVRLRLPILSFALVLVLQAIPPVRAGEPDVARADQLFEQKNYQEAAAAYEQVLAARPEPAALHHASKRLVACRLRLQLFDPALDAAEAYVGRVKGTPYEARAERLAGNLWLTVPHWGTRAGGVFHRAQWKQGIQVRSNRHDKERAVGHLERARSLYAAWDAPDRRQAVADALPEKEAAAWHEERLGELFDLAAACARFGIYEDSWVFWWSAWGERDDFVAETAGEDDFDEYYPDWQLRRRRPLGLRVDAHGDPVFPTLPDAYAPDLPDDQKILRLLADVRDMDRTGEKRFAAESWYRQAMLARARFGMDRLHSYASLYWEDGSLPLQDEIARYEPWELADGEALLIAGGKLRKVTLPPAWNVLGLLAKIPADLPDSGFAPQATYATGVYHQSRQQYERALAVYAGEIETWPKDKWSAEAEKQRTRILARQVRLNPTGVQLPGKPARLQLSYRNLTQLWFTARRIDLEGFLREIRDQEFDPEKGPRDVWSLQNWPWVFTNGWQKDSWSHRLALKHLGDVVATWTDEVPDDGTHRYATATLNAGVSAPGVYLVEAWVDDPATRDENADRTLLDEGDSRAIVVLSDLALVAKPAAKGKLYFVADARTGAPVEGATLDVVEFWSVWNNKQRKSRHFREKVTLTTDADGLALHERPTNRQLGNYHVLARAGEGDAARLAWQGMRWWGGYSPSPAEQGMFAYVVTDRPVYRPTHTVRFKAWIRHRRDGTYRPPSTADYLVRIYDPRGNEVYKQQLQTDAFGGFDSEFTLGEEPALGMYRIQVNGANYLGGQSFRVEEYKKPEFEVTVEPDTTLAKLGTTLKARIKATYYFGAPVTDAEVTYKVFREEYRHTSWPGGRWGWLYGPGYGLPWYPSEWFPWWGRVACCWGAPPWWWASYGSGPSSGVRELVQEGKAKIGADGTLAIEIDTAAALRDHGDRDHRYVIHAEVRDASRRVIEGEGSVKVTRQAFYAFVQGDRGWYRPGEEMTVRLRCETPDGEPVPTEGVMTVSQVTWGGPDNAVYERKELQSFRIATDERGVARTTFRSEVSGQFEFRFEAPDAWGGTVAGYGLAWVCGPDFEGRFERFNDLELISDKRTYRPGETAHVMLNTKRAGSHVLFADDVDRGTLLSWKMLRIDGRSTVVDVPVKKGDVPDFFVEATTVSDLRVHQQAARICVPPEDGIIDVSVATDKPEYRPGETMTVNVEAKTPDGKPAHAQVTLAAFDRSVLYIQPEITPEIAAFFHGRLRYHQPQVDANVTDQFQSWGYLSRPFENLHPLPPSWNGVWGAQLGDVREADKEVLESLSSGAEAETATRRRSQGIGGGAGAPPPSSPAPARDAAMQAESKRGFAAGAKAESGPGQGGEAPFAEATVRTKFADTALWQTTLETGEDGSVQAKVRMPENLTTWKVNAWSMTKETRVGEASTSAVTTKNLIVRLQAPRFFLEYDEVVLSANVHNYLETAKTARVSLTLPEDLLALVGEAPATVDVEVPAGGERRVDWRVKVVGEGTAKITVQALTDEESDAMQMGFPVLVHGMSKQVATTGSVRPEETEGARTVELTVPEKRRPESTRLEVRFSPTLVGAMLDAVPYCLDYPYGCTEQTMSRFLPAVLTLKTLRDVGIRLEDIQKIRQGKMEEIRRIEKGERTRIWNGPWASPVFDTDALNRIVKTSLERIANMQHGDGGWGWWTRDGSSPYLTSYVLHALLLARDADVAVEDAVIQRGLSFLENAARERLGEEHWAPDDSQAFVAYVLSMGGKRAAIEPGEKDERPGDLVVRLWEGRDRLGLYGKLLLSLAWKNLGEEEKARLGLQNVLQYLETNDETQVAWLRTPTSGWWYWWNNDIETNAWAVRALAAIDPHSDVTPRIVKWLLNNRRNGYYWGSTRDTTFCVAALGEFVRISGEGRPDYTVRFDLDGGKVVKEVRIDKDTLFTHDNRFVVDGVALGGGTHTLTITKKGPGALYFNTYLSYFTKEEHITAAGHELKVARQHYLLKRIPYEVEVETADGSTVKEKRLRYERVPLKDGDEVESGDLIQVELKVASDNDYTYLAFEDMKPAGCEPVEVRSGGEGQEGFWSYVEYRDEKVAFFVNHLDQGEHLLRYRLRAEIPGIFHALPTRLFAMYAPKLRANSEETVIRILDR